MIHALIVIVRRVACCVLLPLVMAGACVLHSARNGDSELSATQGGCARPEAAAAEPGRRSPEQVEVPGAAVAPDAASWRPPPTVLVEAFHPDRVRVEAQLPSSVVVEVVPLHHSGFSTGGGKVGWYGRIRLRFSSSSREPVEREYEYERTEERRVVDRIPYLVFRLVE